MSVQFRLNLLFMSWLLVLRAILETEHWQLHVPESRKYKETREIYWISMNIA